MSTTSLQFNFPDPINKHAEYIFVVQIYLILSLACRISFCDLARVYVSGGQPSFEMSELVLFFALGLAACLGVGTPLIRWNIIIVSCIVSGYAILPHMPFVYKLPKADIGGLYLLLLVFSMSFLGQFLFDKPTPLDDSQPETL